MSMTDITRANFHQSETNLKGNHIAFDILIRCMLILSVVYPPFHNLYDKVNSFYNNLEGLLRLSLHKKDYKTFALCEKILFHFLQQNHEFDKSMFFLIHCINGRR